MKVLITGANGLLGTSIIQTFSNVGITCVALDRSQINWASPAQNVSLLQGYDFLLHTAANTNVEQCEEKPEACYRDNVLLTELLARACYTSSVSMVFISSTGIYGSHRVEPYHEYDTVQPTTHHHRAKWLAEGEVLKWLPDALIIRTGWLFGGEAEISKNFVARRIEEGLSVKQQMYSNQEQIGNPTFSNDVAERVLALMQNQQTGIFNCVNSGCASRFDYVKAIIEEANVGIDVLPSKSGSFNRKAKVSNNEAAQNLKMDLLGYPEMRSWQVALAGYINNNLHKWIYEQKLSKKSLVVDNRNAIRK